MSDRRGIRNPEFLSQGVRRFPVAWETAQIVGSFDKIRTIRPRQAMKYKVALKKTEEGFSVSCPGLPGCWSQGETEKEALDNIASAIREYLLVADELAGEGDAEVREVDVAA